MCECHSDAIEALRGTAKLPFGYGVIDKTGEDMELFATRDEAIARARECHRHYPHIRPFRVMRISMHPISDDDPDDHELREAFLRARSRTRGEQDGRDNHRRRTRLGGARPDQCGADDPH